MDEESIREKAMEMFGPPAESADSEDDLQDQLKELRDKLESKVSELPDEPEFKHHDAFMLMDYGCDKCGKVEAIWNGRNNVSPFGTSCSTQNCKGSMIHINWRHDVRVPDYKPPPGSRYFADFTRKRAEEKAAQIIKLYKGTPYEIEPGTQEYNDFYWEQVHQLMNGDCSMDILTVEE